jgi:uncharacterized protein YxeA
MVTLSLIIIIIIIIITIIIIAVIIINNNNNLEVLEPFFHSRTVHPDTKFLLFNQLNAPLD